MADSDTHNPEAEALGIIRTLPVKLLHDDSITLLLHAYAALLAENRIFTGLGGSDSRTVAEAIAAALCHDNPQSELLNMARDATAVGMWRNPEGAARAFSVAAAALR
jgi:hypothetical protein